MKPHESASSMTTRDHVAVQIASGIMGRVGSSLDPSTVAGKAYELADALIAASEASPAPPPAPQTNNSSE
jgi:hypothetical protein